MKTHVQDNGHIIMIQLDGTLDGVDVDALRQCVQDHLRKGRTALMVNMKEVHFISSRGLETLLWIRNACRRCDMQFRLVALTEDCQTILALTRLSNEFVTCLNADDAVKSLV